MIHLRSLTYATPAQPPEVFPFRLPFVRALETLEFPSEVTFLVGENGSGKSTLLEALACAIGSITVGAESVTTDATLAAVLAFAKYLKLTWNKKTKRGFFMRSEDFFGYARKLAQTRAELQAEMDAVDAEYKGRSKLAVGLAKMPYARELGEMKRYYGDDLDANSHGESFFTLFKSRFTPDGLYLLDEPEAPLSPTRQLSFLAMIHEAVSKQNAQMIIATHSPILLAYQNATIYSFDGGVVRRAEYESLEHYRLTRDFLNNPSQFLKHLFSE